MESLEHLILQADNQTPSIFQQLWKTVTMDFSDPRLEEGTFNEGEGKLGSCLPSGGLTTVSALGNLLKIVLEEE